MKIIWLGNTAPTGNLCDMLAYGETLYEAGHDIEFWLTIPERGSGLIAPDSILSFGCSSIPKERVKIIGEGFPAGLVGKVKIPPNTLTIGKEKQWLPFNPDLIFTIWERPEDRNDILWISPTRLLAMVRGALYVPRPANLSFFKEARMRRRKYDVVDCFSYSFLKDMDLLETLVGSYNVKVVCLMTRRQKEDFQMKYPKLDASFNLSRTELAEVYGRSKIFLHPSFLEAASCSLVEAMSAGCYPLLRVGASLSYPEQIGPYGDYIRSKKGLEKKLESLLEADIPHEEIGEWAYRKHHREFNKGTWLELIEKCIKLKENGISPSSLLLPSRVHTDVLKELVGDEKNIMIKEKKIEFKEGFLCFKCGEEIPLGDQTKNSAGEYFCPECVGVDVDILRNPRKR